MVIDLFPHEEPDPIEIYDQNCVMILDRSKEYIDYLTTHFESQSFKVLSFTSGENGFKSATEKLPDCILINLELLDMDGVSLCRAIVDESSTCGIPVILMGKPNDDSVIRKAKAAGCEYFVSKPIDPKALIFLVNESIAEARSWICE